MAMLKNVGNMQKRRTLKAHIHKSRLHAREHADHLAHVNIANQTTPGGALDMQLLHHARLDDRDSRLLRRPVDQDVFVHQQSPIAVSLRKQDMF